MQSEPAFGASSSVTKAWPLSAMSSNPDSSLLTTEDGQRIFGGFSSMNFHMVPQVRVRSHSLTGSLSTWSPQVKVAPYVPCHGYSRSYMNFYMFPSSKSQLPIGEFVFPFITEDRLRRFIPPLLASVSLNLWAMFISRPTFPDSAGWPSWCWGRRSSSVLLHGQLVRPIVRYVPYKRIPRYKSLFNARGVSAENISFLRFC